METPEGNRPRAFRFRPGIIVDCSFKTKHTVTLGKQASAFSEDITSDYFILSLTLYIYHYVNITIATLSKTSSREGAFQQYRTAGTVCREGTFDIFHYN